MKDHVLVVLAAAAGLLVTTSASAAEPSAKAEGPSAQPEEPSADADAESADDAPAHTEPLTPAFVTSRAGGFVDLWPARDNLATIYGVELQIRLARRMFLDVSMTGAYASAHAPGIDRESAGYGNPTIGMHWVGSPSRNLHLYGGFSVTVPLLGDPGDEVSNAAFYGARIRGYYDADRFVLGHAAVRVAGGLEWRIGDSPALLRAEVRPVMFVPTNDKHPIFASSSDLMAPTSNGFASARGRVGFMLEQAVEIEARSDSGFGAGARLQAVIMPAEADMAQTMFEPFVAMTPRRSGVYARIAAPLALDEDLGLGFERNRLAALRFSLGGQW